MGNINSANNALSSGAGGDGDDCDDDEQLNTQSQSMSLPTDTALANNLNSNNATTNSIHPSNYSEDYINDDAEYDFITSAPATPQSSVDKITTACRSRSKQSTPLST